MKRNRGDAPATVGLGIFFLHRKRERAHRLAGLDEADAGSQSTDDVHVSRIPLMRFFSVQGYRRPHIRVRGKRGLEGWRQNPDHGVFLTALHVAAERNRRTHDLRVTLKATPPEAVAQ